MNTIASEFRAKQVLKKNSSLGRKRIANEEGELNFIQNEIDEVEDDEIALEELIAEKSSFPAQFQNTSSRLNVKSEDSRSWLS